MFVCISNSNSLLQSQKKPIPVRWARFYVDQIKYDEEAGRANSLRWVTEAIKIMGGSEGLTALQELVLDGDVNTTMYQIKRLVDLEEDEFSDDDEKNLKESKHSDGTARLPMAQTERSILHYAALTSQLEMCRRLVQETPFVAQLNEPDVVTGFSPLHYASFVQNRDLVYLFLAHGARIDYTDSYGATIVDYLRLQGRIPQRFDRPDMKIKFLPSPSSTTLDTSQIHELSIPQFLEETNALHPKASTEKNAKQATDAAPQKTAVKPKFEWCSQYKITDDYVEELMFGGYEAPTKKDMEFRKKYSDLAERNAGEDGIVVAWVNDEVGWGCYAAKEYRLGDFIVAYTGEFVLKRRQKARDYAMVCSLEQIVLDASKYRNLGAFINHSSKANAEAQGIFDRGIDRIVITATKKIPIGQQICIDYGSAYFKIKDSKDKTAKVSPTAGFVDLLENVKTPTMESTLPANIIEKLTPSQ